MGTSCAAAPFVAAAGCCAASVTVVGMAAPLVRPSRARDGSLRAPARSRRDARSRSAASATHAPDSAHGWNAGGGIARPGRYGPGMRDALRLLAQALDPGQAPEAAAGALDALRGRWTGWTPTSARR